MQFGVDEAGKGPVLGSMFAAAVRADPGALPDDIDDSKNLTPSRRDELAAQLRADERVEIAVAEITPARIDEPETDMNTLTVAAQAEALDGVASDGDDGVVDAGDTDAGRFGCRVADRIAADVSITAEHGADEVYALVGAASVLAKVARDAHVTDLGAEYPDTDVGSGYPSDPATRAFLREYVAEHGDLPPCARRSWSTSQDVLAAAEQSALSEF
ncbi:ribonuclease HII [Halorientalis regularis]|jgi:ribonuclease HII|uniref:Ribonuclease HII n=1 Tax=Halorientalis regularis TaxID=660518 RepID=A0A1G7LA51_9EURY|nr:ribonuclease HII [Halorientalis regularis]SDF46335.1 RNase HII [Halorientalis regularis]